MGVYYTILKILSKKYLFSPIKNPTVNGGFSANYSVVTPSNSASFSSASFLLARTIPSLW